MAILAGILGVKSRVRKGGKVLEGLSQSLSSQTQMPRCSVHCLDRYLDFTFDSTRVFPGLCSFMLEPQARSVLFPCSPMLGKVFRSYCVYLKVFFFFTYPFREQKHSTHGFPSVRAGFHFLFTYAMKSHTVYHRVCVCVTSHYSGFRFSLDS